jgi:hypothetical protein
MGRARWLVIPGVVCLFAGHVRAENKEAEELFRSGRQLVKEGNYAAACTAFEKSNELEPNVNTLLNLADCQEKNQKIASAWRAFVDAEQQTHGKPDDAVLNDVANKRAQALEKRVSFLQITVPETVASIDGVSITLDGKPLSKSFWNTAVAVDSGHHDLVARAPKFQDAAMPVEVQGEAARASVAVAALTPICNDVTCTETSTQPTVTPVHDPERRRLFFGATMGEEEMRGAEGTNWFFALEVGYQRPLASHVFFRIAGGPRYQHMEFGPANAVAVQINPSIGYIAAGRFLVAFEPTLGISSAGNQDQNGSEIDNSANPYYKLATISAAYLHAGVYEVGITLNYDGGLGIHDDTGQLSASFRIHR